MQLLPSVDVARRKEKFLRIAAAAAAAARVGCMGRPVFTPPLHCSKKLRTFTQNGGFFARVCGKKLTREDKNIAKSQQMNFSSDDTPAEKPVREKKEKEGRKIGTVFSNPTVPF